MLYNRGQAGALVSSEHEPAVLHLLRGLLERRSRNNRRLERRRHLHIRSRVESAVVEGVRPRLRREQRGLRRRLVAHHLQRRGRRLAEGLGPANAERVQRPETGGHSGRTHGRRHVHQRQRRRPPFDLQQQGSEHQAVGRSRLLQRGRGQEHPEGRSRPDVGLPVARRAKETYICTDFRVDLRLFNAS